MSRLCGGKGLAIENLGKGLESYNGFYRRKLPVSLSMCEKASHVGRLVYGTDTHGNKEPRGQPRTRGGSSSCQQS